MCNIYNFIFYYWHLDNYHDNLSSIWQCAKPDIINKTPMNIH